MTLTALISIVVVLVVIGCALYLIETYIPMSPPVAVIIRVLIVLACALWLLREFGIIDSVRIG